MKISLISIIAITASLTSGLTLKRGDNIPEGAINDGAASLTWTGAPFPGGNNITLTGTPEDILAQLREINPSYDATPIKRRSDSGWIADGIPLQLDQSAIQLQCQPAGDLAGINACRSAMDYLSNNGMSCHAPTGPGGHGGCDRVSCVDGCGIFLCNDNPYPIDVPCQNLAGDASEILSSCTRYSGGNVKGQVFRKQDSSYGWNTIVKRSNCEN